MVAAAVGPAQPAVRRPHLLNPSGEVCRVGQAAGEVEDIVKLRHTTNYSSYEIDRDTAGPR